MERYIATDGVNTIVTSFGDLKVESDSKCNLPYAEFGSVEAAELAIEEIAPAYPNMIALAIHSME